MEPKIDWVNAGFKLTIGVWQAISCIFVVALLFGLVIDRFWSTHDDSDPINGHSSMYVRTDALTGCQYLVASGITPRLNADGKQVCVRK